MELAPPRPYLKISVQKLHSNATHTFYFVIYLSCPLSLAIALESDALDT